METCITVFGADKPHVQISSARVPRLDIMSTVANKSSGPIEAWAAVMTGSPSAKGGLIFAVGLFHAFRDWNMVEFIQEMQ